MDESRVNSPGDEARASIDQQPVMLRVEPFDPRRLQWQRVRDRWIWRLLVIALMGCFVSLLMTDTHIALLLVLATALVVAWMLLHATNHRTRQQMQVINGLIESKPDMAESLLAQALLRCPLIDTTRLGLYHQVALLRLASHQPAEAAAICATLRTAQPNAQTAQDASLLLTETEALLEMGHDHGAYTCLIALHGMPLSLRELLGLTALQTRYELRQGRDADILRHWSQRVAQAELMPVAMNGTMHAMLAVAARRQQRGTLADRLWQRARLLLTDEQLAPWQPARTERTHHRG